MLNNSQHYVEDCMIQEPIVMVLISSVMVQVPLVIVDGVTRAAFLGPYDVMSTLPHGVSMGDVCLLFPSLSWRFLFLI